MNTSNALARDALAIVAGVLLAFSDGYSQPAIDAHFAHTYIGAKICMKAAGRAAQSLGRSPIDVQTFMRVECSKPLFLLLLDDGMTKYEAAATLANMVRDTYREEVQTDNQPPNPFSK